MNAVTGLDTCPVHHREQVVNPATVLQARRSVPEDPELGKLTDLFRLLGDPTRARILYALLATEELCVCDLAAATRTSETTVSHALRLLRTAGIVAAQRVGRMMYYRLADGHVRLLLEMTREHVREDGGR